MSDQIVFIIVSSNCLLMVSIFSGIPSAVPDPGRESVVFHGFPCLQWKGVGGVSHDWVLDFVPLALIQFAVKYL